MSASNKPTHQSTTAHREKQRSPAHTGAPTQFNPSFSIYSRIPSKPPEFFSRNASQNMNPRKRSSAARAYGEGVGWWKRGSTGNTGGRGRPSSTSSYAGDGVRSSRSCVGRRSYRAEDMVVEN